MWKFSERGDQYTNTIITEPVNNNNVINLQLENLLSTDYKTFELKYFQLCILINPTPIPVRGYILNYLDRLNNNKNQVIPRIMIHKQEYDYHFYTHAILNNILLIFGK